MAGKAETPIFERPAELLQQLIRFDTTNPPGNELGCINHIATILKKAGIKPNIYAKSHKRPNLVSRIKGAGNAPPLLLYAHVDVVTTENQTWKHPPFEGRIVHGVVWGRGAIDDKHAVAMYLSAILKAKAEGISLPGDVIFAACADEEVGGEYGADFLVREHPELFAGVKYALGEFGGFNLPLGGKTVYPIQISEKQACQVRLTFHGRGGHGSMPVKQGAMVKLGTALVRLDRNMLPIHITQPVRMMMTSISRALGGISGIAIRSLLNPTVSGSVQKLLGARASMFMPLLHNTISPTILQAGTKINVIPADASIDLDGRILPGLSPHDLVRELRTLVGDTVDIQVIEFYPGPANLDMGLFDTLADVLMDADPGTTPIPLVGGWATDARHFSHLGIQTYGFTPLKLPPGFDLTGMAHAADERVPISALDFGVAAVLKVLQRFH